MNVFVIHRFQEKTQAENNLNRLAEKSSLNIDFVFVGINQEKWKQDAEKAIEQCEAVIVYNGGACSESENAVWEIGLAKAKSKAIIEITRFEKDKSRVGTELSKLYYDYKFENCFLKKQDRENQNHLELYKLMVESSENLVQRRQNVSSFYSAAIGTLIAIAGILFKTELVEGSAIFVLYGLLAVGLFLCISWRSLLSNYGKLNGAKFDVIQRLEKELDAMVFEAEWNAMSKKKYKSFTKTEMKVPTIFLILIIGMMIALTIWLFREVIFTALASFF